MPSGTHNKVDPARQTGAQAEVDNIADDEAATTQPVEARETDQYIARFHEVSAINDSLHDIANKLTGAVYEHRTQVICDFINKQREFNEATYALLVEMNNYFGKGSD